MEHYDDGKYVSCPDYIMLKFLTVSIGSNLSVEKRDIGIPFICQDVSGIIGSMISIFHEIVYKFYTISLSHDKIVIPLIFNGLECERINFHNLLNINNKCRS